METGEALHPAVIDCRIENLWRLDPALALDGVLIELGDLSSGVSVPNWPERPKEASVVPFRLGEHSEAVGFLVAGIHPGRPLVMQFSGQTLEFIRSNPEAWMTAVHPEDREAA